METLSFLEQRGYLQKWGKETYWTITMRGQVLVHRKFFKSFRPITVRRQVDELVERAAAVNTAIRFPDYVTCLKVTSKYPITVASSGISIAFALNRKNITEEKYEQAANILRRESNEKFGNIVQHIFYPHTAIRKFLKSGSRILKLEQFSAEEIQQLQGTIIFEDDGTSKTNTEASSV
ncbi:hypothetical protein F0L74_24560 [Chitinophaga agrisoli]|uniref:Uncharacterized protein n=1 Tax=Chitinophaga agrisoli TaxID=2607653 RepID=A0A5B2VM96_9BACT|nr:hypothetical protein [Chitinophaga agrisoli]KAA2239377.1 hypothetical protein F0L74_24560 [Chitinophaga agrisoli]